MVVTSQEANKILKKLNEDIGFEKNQERRNMEFTAATIEDKEALRPQYNFMETQNRIALLEEKIRKIKHAINIFNCYTKLEIPGLDLTIDQALVFLPQLTAKKRKLYAMRDVPDHERQSVNHGIIDYNYRNYKKEEAVAEYEAVDAILTAVQNELNRINTTVTFEIPD